MSKILEVKTSPNHQAVVLGIEPFYANEAKLEAYNHLVETRYEWLLSFPSGTDELISEMSYDFLGPNIVELIDAAGDMLKNSDNLEKIAFTLGCAWHYEAERQAHLWARRHIDEVWSKRSDPDFSLDQLATQVSVWINRKPEK